MAHFYVNTIVFLTTLQTITVPRRRMTQCEQWNNEGFFPLVFCLSVAAWRRKKKVVTEQKRGTVVIVFRDVKNKIVLFFSPPRMRQDDAVCVKGRGACCHMQVVVAGNTRACARVRRYTCRAPPCMLTGISGGCSDVWGPLLDLPPRRLT